jgi:hypothetical protein
MIKGYGNYEFMQWLKMFFDANNSNADYDPMAARGGIKMGSGAVYNAKYQFSSPSGKVVVTHPAKEDD